MMYCAGGFVYRPCGTQFTFLLGWRASLPIALNGAGKNLRCARGNWFRQIGKRLRFRGNLCKNQRNEQFECAIAIAEKAPWLTRSGIPIKLEESNRGCPDPRESAAVRFCSFVAAPPGWEVVQLVGLQTLDLAILVRVQASQPISTPHR